MRYELMLPHQIRDAIAKKRPVVLPLGVLEYHGEHMAVGMDTLAVTKILDILESEMDIVILPPFYYGAASYAVEPPEGNGSLHVDAAKLFPFAQEMFRGLLRIGFRNIHVVVHHQTENFATGMPTDLAFKFAARQATFAFLEKERGEGWWGDEQDGRLLRPAIPRRRSFQLDQGASSDDAGSDGGLSVRSCRLRAKHRCMMALCPEASILAGCPTPNGMRAARAIPRPNSVRRARTGFSRDYETFLRRERAEVGSIKIERRR